ncbi:MAG: MbcA/ParS/Xre antitoxin family protein [Acidobacteria bacterium]|nr:MbcA/ParS/Xre antitoxin family protein [Acidobacteriota bacterium]
MAAFRPSYPVTRYEPVAVVDLTSREERERLSPAALKAFFNIIERWNIRDPDARALLGGVSNGPYYKWKKDPSRLLDADALTRISYLVGIFKALNTLYGETLADQWITLPNANRVFSGQPPLAYLKTGGVPAMQTVRRLLDARRGGL